MNTSEENLLQAEEPTPSKDLRAPHRTPVFSRVFMILAGVSMAALTVMLVNNFQALEKVDRAQSDVIELADRKASLLKEIGDVQRQLKSFDSIRRELDRLNEDIGSAKLDLERIKNKVAQGERQGNLARLNTDVLREQEKGTKNSISSLKADLNRLTSQRTRLQREVSNLETSRLKAIDNSNASDKKLLSAQKQLSQIKNRLEVDGKSSESKRAKVLQLEKEFSRLSSVVAGLGGDESRLKSYRSTLEAQISSDKKAAEEANATLTELKSKVIQKRNTTAELKRLITTEERILGDLKSNQVAVKAVLSDLNQKVESLRRSTDLAQSNFEARTKDLTNLQQQLRAEKLNFDALLDNLRTSRARLGSQEQAELSLKRTNAALSREIEQKEAQSESMGTSISSISQQIGKRQSNLDTLESKIRITRSSLKSLQVRMDGLQKEISSLNAVRDGIQSSIDRGKN